MTIRMITVLLVSAIALMPLINGCGTSKTVRGGAIGAAAGGIIGGIIGHQAGNTAAGAIIGAAIGGTAGVLIGNYMDKQAEEMQRDIEGAKIERIGEGIKITFESGILFATNSSDLQPAAQENIGKLAAILQKYDDTNILVEGHTDSTGSAEHNQQLSERRAASVATYAKSGGVKGDRFTVIGYGENQPVLSNTTTEGRQANRRVEIAIFANEDLKEAAEKNQIK
ncbi:MAG TPA: OmpA family protein [Bacteroidota bacterium]|nr:OmpA family protein [Bacteroidota bacterium]